MDKGVRAGQKIILTGWIGLDGMQVVMDKKERELRERFSRAFLAEIKEQADRVPACPAEEMEALTGETVRPVGEGGIFAALWDLAKEEKTGLHVDLKKFPVRQETIEICELYRLNPYQLRSGGGFLIVTEDESRVVKELSARGIPAAVIGELTNNNDKIIQNGEDIRYIDRPAPDELEKIL